VDQVNIHDAKTNLWRLVEATRSPWAERLDAVIVTRDDAFRLYGANILPA
jgi:hypothetical protein